jgi:hypothetical protein
MSDLRSRAKRFFNALDFDTPINFGVEGLVENSLGEELYVPSLHGKSDSDSVQQLADYIDFSESAGAYLFTGNRGTGKTTELLRLAKILDGYGLEVFYVDMTEYLNLSQRVEISDFLISVLGAFSEKVGQRIGSEPGKKGFFERVCDFLQTDVKFSEFNIKGPVEFKAALNQNPTFKDKLQIATRGHLEQLVKQGRDFALEAVMQIRHKRGDKNRKVVLIVDSVERLRGVGDASDVQEVFKSAETLFSSHSDKLRFTGLNVVYTVPPYLQALAGALGASYAGGQIYALPSVHVYQCKPAPGLRPAVSKPGVDKMLAIVAKRYPDWSAFFTENQLSRLATSSGGDLRDFFRMMRLTLTRTPAAVAELPVPDFFLDDAENAVRNDMLPIADIDRKWLAKISLSHEPELPSLDELPNFARLQQGKYLLNYRNGESWYDVHPLLWEEVKAHGG